MNQNGCKFKDVTCHKLITNIQKLEFGAQTKSKNMQNDFKKLQPALTKLSPTARLVPVTPLDSKHCRDLPRYSDLISVN